MISPPFRLAPTSSKACCMPQENIPPMALPLRRARLVDLDLYFHCSIIGTCLGTAELRKLITRFALIDQKRSTDLEIHHTAVALSTEGGAAGKAINKALDDRYVLALKRFKSVKDEAGLRARWREAMESGDIPGAYWAVMTHPCTTTALRDLAFGDVHMLSHLVGAANRADIRRLVAIEAECAALKEKSERQHARLHEMSTQRDAALRQLDEQATQLAVLQTHQGAQPDADGADGADEIARLQQALHERDNKLALHMDRRREAEHQLSVQEESMEELRAAVERLQAEAAMAHAETHAVEQALAQSIAPDPGVGTWQALQGKRIVYVGGRPGLSAVLERMVTVAGGELTVHDGGIEDRKGQLAAILSRAHLVVFPVDCISHDAMHTIKRHCARHEIDYYPVRSASVASFADLIGRLAPAASHA
jgi:hypothetical protein